MSGGEPASASSTTSDTPLDRDLFPVAEHVRYFDHAGVAPISRLTAQAVAEWAAGMCERGRLDHDARFDRIEEVRTAAAQLMGVPATDVAFVKNTTEGLGFVASGLDWAEGDRVLVPDFEFPSTLYPWLALRDRGVQVDLVQPVGPARALPLERFEEELAVAPTRLVAVSWVQFGRGWRTDLAALGALCAEHGALLCADAIQGLGVLPADLARWGVDFAMADGHKWMLAPEGIGVLYVAERSRDLLRPLEPGWNSVAHRTHWDDRTLVFDDTARRFEGGTPNMAGTMGLGAALDLLLAAGIDAVWRHVDGLCDRLAAGLEDAGATVLSDRSADGRSGIVTFTAPDQDYTQVAAQLWDEGFVVSPRGGGVRVSPHGYNTADEIDALITAVGAFSTK